MEGRNNSRTGKSDATELSCLGREGGRFRDGRLVRLFLGAAASCRAKCTSFKAENRVWAAATFAASASGPSARRLRSRWHPP